MQADANGRNLYDFFHLEKNKNYKGRDTNVVLVQVENGRGKIADQLKMIESAKSAVIGIDAVFTARKDFPEITNWSGR